MEKKLSIWKDKSAIGSMGRLIVIYIMIGATVLAASEALKGQAAIFGAGNVSLSMTAINISDLELAPMPAQISGTDEGVTTGQGGYNVVGAAWDLLKSLGTVMFWPQTITNGILAESCTPPCNAGRLVENIGFILSIMFLVSVAYFFRSGT